MSEAANPSRRATLGLFASAPAAAYFAAGAVALGSVDPVFAAIERHKMAFKALGDASSHADEFNPQNEGRAVTEADEDALTAAIHAENEREEAFLNTAPTTAAGMRAALEHAIFLDAGFVPDTWGALARSFLASPLLAV